VPAAFGPGDWSITDLGSGGDARLSITALPDEGGDALTALFYSIDGGARVRLPSVAVGSHDLMDLFTDGVPATVGLRAENLYGPGPESAPKPVTTTGPQTGPRDLADHRYRRRALHAGRCALPPVAARRRSPTTATAALPFSPDTERGNTWQIS
jgi:hypothetical protein